MARFSSASLIGEAPYMICFSDDRSAVWKAG